MKTMNKLAILASVLLSAACAPAAKLADSSVELPERYPAASGTDTTTVADVSWTEFFPDTLLQRHIRTALEGNFSFLNCMNRIRLAENELKTARLGYWPSVSAGLSAGLERFGEYTMDGVGNSTTNTPDLDKSRHIPDPYPDFGIGVSFSWEIDLWGKVTQKKRAALSRWMASIEAASLAYEIAAGLTAPVFNAGKIRNEYSDALVRRDMAVNNYKETVVKAYSEVCGLIESSENIRERIDVKKEEMKIGKKATASANELFRMQFIGYLEVLAADRDYFECCESYIDLEIERMKLQADLYRALGGGGFPAEGTATAQ